MRIVCHIFIVGACVLIVFVDARIINRVSSAAFLNDYFVDYDRFVGTSFIALHWLTNKANKLFPILKFQPNVALTEI